MAQFRATIQGQRGEASRLGSKKSGLTVNVNGWKGGVRIEARYDAERDCDVFEVYATNGSGHGHNDGYLGQIEDGRFMRMGVSS